MHHFIGSQIVKNEEDVENKHLPVWKQTVTDSEGRRRFHGAFTGGFSAGYFNTVGSKEGWAPKSFVSSRKQRAQYVQKQEDYMDDEDFDNSLPGGKALVTRADYEAAPSVTPREDVGSRILPGPMPTELLTPSQATIGVRLLRLMGWKEGQQLGCYTRRRGSKEPPAGEKRRVFGLQISLEELLSDEAAPPETAHAEPEELTPVVRFTPKNNMHGIGYDPFREAPELRGRKGIQQENNNKNVIAMSGFLQPKSSAHSKLGADGHGIYTTDSMDSYDQELGEDIPRPDSTTNRKSGAALGTDGEAPLRNFIPSRLLPVDRWYSPPDIPKDFVPTHRFDDTLYTAEGPGVTMDAKERGNLLGEQELPSRPKSVFAYLSEQDRRRLAAMGVGPGASAPVGKTTTEATPAVPGGTTLGGGLLHQAFSHSPAKQERWRLYLLEQSGEKPSTSRAYDGMTEWELQQERAEFAALSAQFKRLPASMAHRFTPAQSPEVGKAAKEATTEGDYQHTAAAMKMFGRLTRKDEDWFPVSLLCKRFNVPPPHGKSQQAPPARPVSALDVPLLPSFVLPTAPKTESQPVAKEEKPPSPAREAAEDILEQERPPIDLFKAIFEEDEEDTPPASVAASEGPSNPAPDNEPEKNAATPSKPYSPPHVEQHRTDNPYLFIPSPREVRGGAPLQLREDEGRRHIEKLEREEREDGNEVHLRADKKRHREHSSHSRSHSHSRKREHSPHDSGRKHRDRHRPKREKRHH